MPTMDQAVEAYIKLRDTVDDLKKRQSEEMKPYREKMGLLEAFFLQELNRQNAEKVGTAHGTAFKTTRSSSKVEDWEEVLKFIREHDLWHMLERRVAKTAVEEYLEAHGELPPGVTISREVVVQVRRK